MKLTTRSRYGIRMLLDIAGNGQDGPVSIRDVAERQGLSEKYLEKLIRDLKHAGIITSKRGPGGGHRLAENPDNITVGDVIRVFEGGLDLVDCTPCPRMESCVTCRVWNRINDSLARAMDGITLAEMLVELKAQNGEECRSPACAGS